MLDLPHLNTAPAILRPAPDGYARNKNGLLVPRDAGMPGMFNPMFVSGGKAVKPFAFRGSAVSNSTGKFTVPATVQAGDLLVYWEASATYGVAPSGFTFVDGTSYLAIRCNFSYKRATGAEAGTTIQGVATDDANGSGGILLAFSGNFTTYTPSLANRSAGASNPSAKTIVASGQTDPLVVIVGWYASGDVDPRTFTPAADGEITRTTRLWVKYKIYNSSPQDVTFDMDDEGSNHMMGLYIKGTD